MRVSGGEQGRRIAVVGSGIAGLSAAWLLAKRHHVTLYEADRRLGGHANTVPVVTSDGVVPVDTGFIVHNDRTYPNLTQLLAHLGTKTYSTDMSFSASLDSGRIEYSSTGINGFLGQRSNLVRPGFWLMLRDILRFYTAAPKLLARSDLAGVTLGDYLHSNNYSASFVDEHLLPMGAAIWSTTARQMRAYPLVAFVRFFASHGLIDLHNRPDWRSVIGGSADYVEKMAAAIADIRLNTRVRAILRKPGAVEISDVGGHTDTFDDIVIASHADHALAMLADADKDEREVLGAFRYTDNTAVLHTDETLMPKRRRVWSSWNYMGEGQDDERQLCVTYWMNLLQKLDTRQQIFVTLNPVRPVRPGEMIEAIHYRHPLFDHAALDAQSGLGGLQGQRNTWFCGSYFGHGFHEDALQSGLEAAELAGGVVRPWKVSESSRRIAARPVLEAAE